MFESQSQHRTVGPNRILVSIIIGVVSICIKTMIKAPTRDADDKRRARVQRVDQDFQRELDLVYQEYLQRVSAETLAPTPVNGPLSRPNGSAPNDAVHARRRSPTTTLDGRLQATELSANRQSQ